MAATPQGTSIDVTRVREFSERVHDAAQQMKSRLRDKSIVKYFKAKDMAYDGMESIEATDANARFAKLDFADLVHNRRQILPNRWQVTLPYDGKDSLEALFDYENQYEKYVAAAMMRRFDRTGITALLADVNTGENFQTTVNAATDGVVTVDATAGLTYEKLLEINETFIDNDLMIDMEEESNLIISGKEHTSLMSEAELTSGDYSREFYVEKGLMQKAAGLNLIKYAANASTPMIADNGVDTRNCIAFAENALCYGIQKEIDIEVRKLDDYVDTWVVICTGSFGAVRTEGKRVIQVNTAL